MIKQFTYWSFAALCLTMLPAVADSQKIRWDDNGHNYQRFDKPNIAWTAADSACKAMGASLVTITSAAEQQFVYDKLVSLTSSTWYFAIGASDAATEHDWQWVTGENSDGWIYQNWNPEYPHTDTSRNYLYMLGTAQYAKSTWIDSVDKLDGMSGYICEWSGNTYIKTVRVDDLNNNGYPEDAALYVDYQTYKHTVAIIDRKTHKAVRTPMTFAQDSRAPKGLVVITDINGNGKQEVGVLDMDYNVNMPVVNIRDLSSKSANYLKYIRFFLDGLHQPVSVDLESDISGNQADEITVMAVNKLTNKADSETRDSKTGRLLYTNKF